MEAECLANKWEWVANGLLNILSVYQIDCLSSQAITRWRQNPLGLGSVSFNGQDTLSSTNSKLWPLLNTQSSISRTNKLRVYKMILRPQMLYNICNNALRRRRIRFSKGSSMLPLGTGVYIEICNSQKSANTSKNLPQSYLHIFTTIQLIIFEFCWTNTTKTHDMGDH